MLTTKIGLQIPVGLSFEEWERAGRQLTDLIDSSCWWLGDWLLFGKDHYADRYERGIRAVGLQYQTLRNYAWVARKFKFNRRRSALTFQHHAELASLPVNEQELWLDRAERLNWTTKQLRGALRAAKDNAEPVPVSSVEATRRLALPGPHVQRWHLAAAQSGVKLEQWVLVTLDKAAERILKEIEVGTGV
ncbi:LmbU family transcriptional regulator [Nonomuraea sp. NPDC002799]